MLREPDDVPNTPLLRWVAWCRLFDFEPHHVPASQFKVEDALSRRPAAPEDVEYENPDDEDTEEAYLYSIYGSADHVPADATITSATKYLFDSLAVKYSGSVNCNNYSHSQVPFLWATQSIQLVEIGPGEKITAPIKDNLPFSLIRASVLRNINQDST